MTVTINGTSGITSPAIDVTTPITVADGGTGLTSVGASGNVLTSDGTSWVSSAPSGGVTSFNGNTGALAGWQYITSGTFTSATTVNMTGLPSNYRMFRIVIEGTAASGTTGIFGIRGSTNNGSSYLSTTIYNMGGASSGNAGLSNIYTELETALYPAAAYPLVSPTKFYFDVGIVQSTNSQYTWAFGNSAFLYSSTWFFTALTGNIQQTSYLNAFQLIRTAGNTAITGSYQIYGSQ